MLQAQTKRFVFRAAVRSLACRLTPFSCAHFAETRCNVLQSGFAFPRVWWPATSELRNFDGARCASCARTKLCVSPSRGVLWSLLAFPSRSLGASKWRAYIHLLAPKQPTHCSCPSFSSIWLVGMNVLYFILGLVMIGLSSWGITQQKEDVVTAGG